MSIYERKILNDRFLRNSIFTVPFMWDQMLCQEKKKQKNVLCLPQIQDVLSGGTSVDTHYGNSAELFKVIVTLSANISYPPWLEF